MNKKNALQNYEIARKNLLLVIILTAVNFALAFFGADVMMLFSASLPYFLFIVGIYYFEPMFAIIAIVLVLVYLIIWYFSKKHVGWMIAALVLFVIDTGFMFWMYDFTIDASVMMDLLIHGWVLFYLVSGVIYGIKKDKNEEIIEVENTVHDQMLRLAEDTKARVFLEEEILGKQVVYRRVKTVNELVINGKVYDEYDALIEKPHALYANLDGHTFEAGCNTKSQLYLAIDGEIIKKKIRLV